MVGNTEAVEQVGNNTVEPEAQADTDKPEDYNMSEARNNKSEVRNKSLVHSRSLAHNNKSSAYYTHKENNTLAYCSYNIRSCSHNFSATMSHNLDDSRGHTVSSQCGNALSDVQKKAFLPFFGYTPLL